MLVDEKNITDGIANGCDRLDGEDRCCGINEIDLTRQKEKRVNDCHGDL